MTLIERIGRFVESGPVQSFISVLIVLNAITLGLQTVPSVIEAFGAALDVFDQLVLIVFVLEIGGKLAWRRVDFFRNGWNIFDFAIVAIALMPTTGELSVLRALRILRTLRLMSVVPAMRRVIGALFTAIPGIASVGAIILLLFYVSAVLTTNFFAATFPEWFGSIGASMYTLFQIMTLESWSMGIVRPVMEQHPWAWVFFVPFILITSFAILNLFIGIIVDAMQSQHALEEEAASHEDALKLEAELADMKDQLKQIRGLLEQRS
ncbi:ion transporter [Magnetospira sp. QH-2]|uniref:ion transporter n=1 Tax=Magnetospira sp. (strain QH-2) TaxID=1288970 RepID=UPI0003E80E74|nr:ion transporter [Magnetospira sp. QH-2]CCQ74820.1 putative transporter, cation channel family [Magnetospira sp. QH-2]